jgi:ribonucleoside-diphosphate reductase alpha chain
VRHRLPAERASVTHKFGIAGHEGYITVGLYPNGQPGEIFIRMAKEGSTVSGLMDSFATAISLALQHGVPLRVLCEKFAHTRFEPSGWTGNPEIGFAKSIMDYIFRWLQIRFLSGLQLDLFAGLGPAAAPVPTAIPVEGTVSAPGNTVSLTTDERSSNSYQSVSSAIASRVPMPEVTPQTVLERENRATATEPKALSGPQALSDQDIFNNGPGSQTPEPPPVRARAHFEDRPAPQQGIAAQQVAADLAARNGMSKSGFEDRGIYHAADAMKSMYDMGDAPSCATCGAIMTRSGSCYRCMSCGSTSGCS